MDRSALGFKARRIADRLAVAAALATGPNNADPVFVLATGRSGSHLLVDYLDSLPGVAFRREILNQAIPIGIPYRRGKPAVERHITRAITSLRASVPGAKILLDQMRWAKVTVHDLRRLFPGVRFLLLYRESLAEQYVSFRVAQETSRWVSEPGTAPFTGQVHIDPDAMARFFAEIRSLYADVTRHEWMRRRTFALSYEELVGDPQGLFASALCPFLGVPFAPVRTRRTKQVGKLIDSVISNYAEVKPLLNSTVARLELSVAPQ